ncbi:PQQ-binding-like beta-propeller repeat protein [Devosia sp. FJ2-5-3]|jgi:PQQ-dependent dehydrogenase (methanol/ethanol family)|uniref:pyrroloquinoline quinone-dependent dehydrogenase n=1 Tax=Devosia sp. FJ2-5-3 TaxID=2976680 RepID=UPI0023D7CAC6|nr:PQQ-binding-like beta-propeller repeat protein [Devosia sp. FJ2-5-3]WEJ57924.1 PQQ-binding-like beta-propeller repeat protein [Devosia sp. FJ2-5-3]
MKMNALSALLLGTALALTSLPVAAQSDLLENMSPVTDEMIQNPDPGSWLSWRRTLDNQGFSPLDQINKDNVSDLQVVWSRGMTEGFQEAAPLVHDGVMFLPHPRDIIQALDATTGDLLWEYKREVPANAPMIITTRNIAIWGDLLVFSSKDNYLVALNAKTGQLAWETQLRDENAWAWSTPGPIIVNGKAISGRSCAQQPSGDTPVGGPETCYLTAHDMKTGEELWRFHTLPHGDMAGSESWNGVDDSLRHHVGSWISPSYDPELNLVYFGTSVTSPYSKFYFANFDSVEELEEQEFLYQTSTLALDADTGELKWYQQHIRDHWDLDHPFERILVDTAIAPNADEVRWINPAVTPGEERRVVTGIPGKTGIFYSMDAATGEFLWARETTYQNVISDIDTTTGRATHPLDMIPTEIGQSLLVCPSDAGGKRWFTSAYSPLTNAIYSPLANFCMQSVTLPNDIRLSPDVLAPGTSVVGRLNAISVETGEELWSLDQEDFTTSLLATQGGLLFGGDTNRRFRAYDQTNGEVLFETIVPSAVGGVPITYEVGDRQYVAVPVGSWLDMTPYVDNTPRDIPMGGNAIVVYALPQK